MGLRDSLRAGPAAPLCGHDLERADAIDLGVRGAGPDRPRIHRGDRHQPAIHARRAGRPVSEADARPDQRHRRRSTSRSSSISGNTRSRRFWPTSRRCKRTCPGAPAVDLDDYPPKLVDIYGQGRQSPGRPADPRRRRVHPLEQGRLQGARVRSRRRAEELAGDRRARQEADHRPAVRLRASRRQGDPVRRHLDAALLRLRRPLLRCRAASRTSAATPR